MSKKIIELVFGGLLTALAAVISALGLHLFVFPVNFAPAGVDGISTMLQSMTGINAGYYGLIINVPLLIAGWFFISRKYVVYTLIFTVFNSGLLFLLPMLDLSWLSYESNDLLSALFAGVVLGFRAAVMLRIGGSSGGLDIIAGLLQKKYTHVNFEHLLFVLNSVIIAGSFFAYGFNLHPIMLSILYCFVYSWIIGIVMQGPKCALEFRIVTNMPEVMTRAIIAELKHGVTVVPSKGGFTNQDNVMLFCVINKREVSQFLNIIHKHMGTFVYYSEVNNVIGNFRRGRNEVPK